MAQAHTMKDAKALAARITIADNRNDTEITYRTNISGTDTVAQMKGPNPDKCTITYAVFLPDGNSLKITNQFGNTQLCDYGGRLEIDEKFGDFNAGIGRNLRRSRVISMVKIDNCLIRQVRPMLIPRLIIVMISGIPFSIQTIYIAATMPIQ